MADSSKENTEAIIDTIKSELAIGFKNCIDKIDTERKVVDRYNWEIYVKMNKILHNSRRLDPQWAIEGDIGSSWSLRSILERDFKSKILNIDLSEIDSIDLEGYEELHQSLKDLRTNNPGWSINKTRRDSPILLTPTQIGLQEENTSQTN
jgi:hypothetical protein